MRAQWYGNGLDLHWQPSGPPGTSRLGWKKGRYPWPDGRKRPGGALPEARAPAKLSPPWRGIASGDCAVH
eukprot:388546-Pyramimonas_sp.AAC.1